MFGLQDRLSVTEVARREYTGTPCRYGRSSVIHDYQPACTFSYRRVILVLEKWSCLFVT